MKNITHCFQLRVLFSCLVFTLVNVSLYAQTAEEWTILGNAASDSLEYDQAIEYYLKAIEVDNNYFDAYLNLGLTYVEKENYDKAIEYFDKALAIDSLNADTYFILGNTYVSGKQDYDKAIELFKKGLKLKPDSPEEYFLLGFLYKEKGNYTYGIMYAKKAARLGSITAQLFFTENNMSWEDNFVKLDYEQIKKNIDNKESNLYYSKLWDRFQKGDSTMTMEEKYHLYYGYVFNKKYSPYTSFSDSKTIMEILNKQNITEEDWTELISLTDVAQKVDPFSIRNIYYQKIGYEHLGKSNDATINDQKIRCILNAMSSTGDALSKETAIHVIAVNNEYDYMFSMNVSMESQVLIDGGYDLLYLQPNEDGIEELWFDIKQPLEYLMKTYK